MFPNLQHIELWVNYMWHVRPQTADWAIVSGYFVQLILQNSLPLWYANGERYSIPWSDVKQVIPFVLLPYFLGLSYYFDDFCHTSTVGFYAY